MKGPPTPDEFLKKFLPNPSGKDKGDDEVPLGEDIAAKKMRNPDRDFDEMAKKKVQEKKAKRLEGAIKQKRKEIMVEVDDIRNTVEKVMDQPPKDLERMVDELYDDIDEKLQELQKDVKWHVYHGRDGRDSSHVRDGLVRDVELMRFEVDYREVEVDEDPIERSLGLVGVKNIEFNKYFRPPNKEEYVIRGDIPSDDWDEDNYDLTDDVKAMVRKIESRRGLDLKNRYTL